jgi:hypothetical protein
MMADREFHQAIHETLMRLESISRTATNQREKFKRLHIRHAALTMSTEDISRLILQKAGDLPEPKQTIIDKTSGEERPCKSIQEIMESTKDSSQQYMSPSAAARQLHFVSTTSE